VLGLFCSICGRARAVVLPGGARVRRSGGTCASRVRVGAASTAFLRLLSRAMQCLCAWSHLQGRTAARGRPHDRAPASTPRLRLRRARELPPMCAANDALSGAGHRERAISRENLATGHVASRHCTLQSDHSVIEATVSAVRSHVLRLNANSRVSELG
jgi:hypothetical protein